ncbi:MAG: hypothetical protein DSZ25_03355, partial [Thermovibrio sp.]
MNLKTIICKGEKEQLESIATNLLLWIKKKPFFEVLLKKHFLSEEDIKNEIIVCILSKKEYLCQKKHISFSLLCTIVKNYFLDLNKKKNIEHDERNVSYTSEIISEDEKLTVEDLLVDYHNSPNKFVEILYIEELVNYLNENLSKREKETLCFQIEKLKETPSNPFLRNLSEDAKYQAFRRLKQKIKK